MLALPRVSHNVISVIAGAAVLDGIDGIHRLGGQRSVILAIGGDPRDRTESA
jgi:hypothetical protein